MALTALLTGWLNIVSIQRAFFGREKKKAYCDAGVQPQWIQGDSKVGGQSRRLWKNTYLITDIERLEMDSAVGRFVEKKRLNNLDYVE